MAVIKLHDAVYADGNGTEISVEAAASIGLEIGGLEAGAVAYPEGQIHGEGGWFAIQATNPQTGALDTQIDSDDLDSDLLSQWSAPVAGLASFRVRIAGTVDSDLGSDSDGYTGPGFSVYANSDISVIGTLAATTVVSEWTPFEIEVLGDSDTGADLSITVPAQTEYHIMSVYATLTTDSDVSDSDRQLELQVIDTNSSVVARFVCGTTQVVSTTVDYVLAPGVIDLTAVRDTTYVSMPIPATLILPAGYQLRVYDNTAAGEDPLDIWVMVQQRTV